MEFIVKKTHELSQEDLLQVKALFEKTFHKERSLDILMHQYIQNPLGFSWHSLLVDEGKIHGLNTFIPAYYLVNGKKLLFANSVDSIVDKPYRDFFNFSDMLKAGFKVMKKEGVAVVYGYPNDNSYPVLTKGKIYKDAGKMHTYCLPYRLGGVKPAFSILNPVSMVGARLFASFSSLFASSKRISFSVEKDLPSYNATRYKRNDGDYGIVENDGIWLSYKIQEQEGVRTAFIIDVDPKSPKNFVRAVKWLLKHESRNFDLILYPGYLPFSVTGMIRLPKKIEPKNFNFVVKVLDKSAVGDEVFDIRNWDTNLSNYDLL